MSSVCRHKDDPGCSADGTRPPGWSRTVLGAARPLTFRGVCSPRKQATRRTRCSGFGALLHGPALQGPQSREQHVARAVPLGSSLSGFCRALPLRRRGGEAGPAAAASGMGSYFQGPLPRFQQTFISGAPPLGVCLQRGTPRSPIAPPLVHCERSLRARLPPVVRCTAPKPVVYTRATRSPMPASAAVAVRLLSYAQRAAVSNNHC